jgi:predicted Kef-type K+ transport protein
LDLDPVLIGVAFVMGFVASRLGLPPLAGFLVAGFVLHALGLQGGEALARVSDLGITLLLFTIGLKLDLASLLRREVWATTLVHATASTIGIGALLLGLGALGIPLVAELDPGTALLLGFAFCFSSTVFAVKVLEEKGETGARHGVTAVGILIVQDLMAVVFLVILGGKLPSAWAFALFALPLLRAPLSFVMTRLGHGEVMLLFGFAMALLGYQLFEAVGLKGDLGALAFGVLLGAHPKGYELAQSLMAFKELFLVGFFLLIGLEGLPGDAGLVLALALVTLIPVKGALFFGLLSGFGLRVRTAGFTALALTNFSEFGLIVASSAKVAGWLPDGWMAIIGVSVALSFLASAPANTASHGLHERFRARLRRFERSRPIDAPEPIPASDVIVLGMGRVGSGAYDELCSRFGSHVIGVDVDAAVVEAHREAGRRAIRGDATDPDFWLRCPGDVRVVLVAMSDHVANLFAVREVRSGPARPFVVAAAQFPDQVRELREAGADAVFDFYSEAGVGLADHAADAVLGAGASRPE